MEWLVRLKAIENLKFLRPRSFEKYLLLYANIYIQFSSEEMSISIKTGISKLLGVIETLYESINENQVKKVKKEISL